MIGIIGAMEEEVAELKKDMQIDETIEQAGMVFCKGSLGGKDRYRRYGDLDRCTASRYGCDDIRRSGRTDPKNGHTVIPGR